MGFVKLDTVLQRHSRKSSTSQILDPLYVVNSVSKILVHIFGETVLDSVSVVSFSRKVITIEVQSSAWAQEIRMHESEILMRLDSDHAGLKLRFRSR
jgi:Dna[CI] antecedent, DciA